MLELLSLETRDHVLDHSEVVSVNVTILFFELQSAFSLFAHFMVQSRSLEFELSVVSGANLRVNYHVGFLTWGLLSFLYFSFRFNMIGHWILINHLGFFCLGNLGTIHSFMRISNLIAKLYNSESFQKPIMVPELVSVLDPFVSFGVDEPSFGGHFWESGWLELLGQ